MSADRVGVAIEANVVRAVVRTRKGVISVEVPWDATHPEQAVAELRDRIGDVREIALSIGLGFLAIAKPALPPLAGDAARRILLRDADRHFPLDGNIAIAVTNESEFAFATPGAMLQSWVNAFRAWAPVASVHAAPHAIARALKFDNANTLRSFTIDAGANERGLLGFSHGRLTEVRRLPETMAAATLNGARPIPDALTNGAQGRFAAAIGVLDASNVSLDTMLLDAPLERSLRQSQRARLWRSAALFAASVLILLWAANAQRNRTLEGLESSIRAIDGAAAPSYAAQSRLVRANAELGLLNNSDSTTSNDALSVLARVSQALPAGVVVQRADWDGAEWRIDGSTDNASQIVPALDGVSTFANVHALGASSRFRDGARMRETFSVAFSMKGGTHVNK